jgi:hypothetical protein
MTFTRVTVISLASAALLPIGAFALEPGLPIFIAALAGWTATAALLILWYLPLSNRFGSTTSSSPARNTHGWVGILFLWVTILHGLRPQSILTSVLLLLAVTLTISGWFLRPNPSKRRSAVAARRFLHLHLLVGVLFSGLTMWHVLIILQFMSPVLLR